MKLLFKKDWFFRASFILGICIILKSCTEEVTINLNENIKGSVPITSLEDGLGNKMFYNDTSDNLSCIDTTLMIMSQGVYKNEDFSRTIEVFKNGKPFTGTAYLNKPDSDEIAKFMRFKNGFSDGYSRGVVINYAGLTHWETIQFDFYENGYLKATANSDVGALDNENKRVGKWLIVDSTIRNLNFDRNIYIQDTAAAGDTMQVENYWDYLSTDSELTELYEIYNWKKKVYTVNYNHKDYIQTRDGPAKLAAKSFLKGIAIVLVIGAILLIAVLVLVIVLIRKAFRKN